MKKTENTNVKEFLNVINTTVWKDSKRMQEYAKSICSDVFKSSKGNLVEFEKPRIKTNFCFGHGQNGITTEEETKSACSQAEYARTNEQYFLDENLEAINEKIKFYKESESLYLLPQYRDVENIAYVVNEEYFRHYPSKQNNILQELNEEERENLIKICESEKEKFTKRLNTYLKRYGLSKINSWTYLVD